MTIVDIHCHTFNADDLPIRGFVEKVAFSGSGALEDVAKLIDRIIQGAAPGFDEERRRLDRLLGVDLPGLPADFGPQSAGVGEMSLDDEVELALAELVDHDPELALRVEEGLLAHDGETEEFMPQGVFDRFRAIRRAIRWAKIFGKHRVDITALLLTAFGRTVDLSTPLLVDLAPGLGDRAATTIGQQVELHEKISRLSMLGRLPREATGHVHPFVGFDPRREAGARLAADPVTPLDRVKEAILVYGFVGVKMYPPMGFLPLGNDGQIPDGGVVDEVLRDLYQWCVEVDVPLTVHGNPSNFAEPAFREFSSPAHWRTALEAFPDLRLNLGHFGGARDVGDRNAWPRQIARLVQEFDHLHADVGNHRIHDDRLATDYFAMLDDLFTTAATEEMANRLMWGSDWYMLALHADHGDFLDTYERLYQDRFGTDRTNRFLGANALRFLGFDDPANNNNRRLRQRYEKVGVPRPGWLAGP